MIIASTRTGREPLSQFNYYQMKGRAGRKGLDDLGESILMIPDNNRADEERAMRLIREELQPVRSKSILYDQRNDSISMSEAFKRFTLESIATGMLSTFDEIREYLNSTFFAHQTRKLRDDEINWVINALNNNEESRASRLVALTEDQGVTRFVPSKLASAILASSMSPGDALRVYEELKKSMFAIALNCDLHLLYHMIPNANVENRYVEQNQWTKFANILLKIDEGRETELERNVIALLEIQTGYVIARSQEPSSSGNSAERRKHLKFNYALALMDIMNEMPLGEVARKFGMSTGDLQAIQSRSSSYCGMLAVFTKKLGWENLSLLIKNFQDRLCFGVNQDLIELMSISCLNGRMARLLHKAGFTSVNEIAYAKNLDIERVFLDVPVESSSGRRRFWVSNFCKSMTESEISHEIIKQAQTLVEMAAGRKLAWGDEVKDAAIYHEPATPSSGGSRNGSPTKRDGSQDRTRLKVVNYAGNRLSQVSPGRTGIRRKEPRKEARTRLFSSQEPSASQEPSESQASSCDYEINWQADSPEPSDASTSGYHKRPPAESTEKKRPTKRHKGIANSTSIYPNNSNLSDRDVIFSESQLHSSIEGDFAVPNDPPNNSTNASQCSNTERSRQLDLASVSSSQLSGRQTKIASEQVENSSHNRDQILFESTEEIDEAQAVSQIATQTETPIASQAVSRTANQTASQAVSQTASQMASQYDQQMDSQAGSFCFNESLSAGSKANSTVAKLDRGRSESQRARDEECFKIVDLVSAEFCEQVDAGDFRYSVRKIDSLATLNSFLSKFEKAPLLLVNFKMDKMPVYEKDFLKDDRRCVQDTKVKPYFIDRIQWMCVMIGTNMIYSLDREWCQEFKKRIRAGAEESEQTKIFNGFTAKAVPCVSFDSKFTLKMFKCCFEMSDENLAKITWYDPKVAHWLLNPDAREPESILEIAEEYLELQQPKNFIQKWREQAEREKELPPLAPTILLYPVLAKLRQILKEKKLYESYVIVEMPVLTIFANIELNGFTFDREYVYECTDTWGKLSTRLNELIGKNGGKVRGKTLNVAAPDEVQKVFTSLKIYKAYKEKNGLSPNFPDSKLKTGKGILEELKEFHPLPGRFN